MDALEDAAAGVGAEGTGGGESVRVRRLTTIGVVVLVVLEAVGVDGGVGERAGSADRRFFTMTPPGGGVLETGAGWEDAAGVAVNISSSAAF